MKAKLLLNMINSFNFPDFFYLDSSPEADQSTWQGGVDVRPTPVS